jgi:type VI secretion system secreted protein VgrG
MPDTNWRILLTAPAFGDETLSCDFMRLHEELGQPFECELYLKSDNPNIAFKDVLGKDATVSWGPIGEERQLHGLVCMLTQHPDENRRAVYHAIVRPAVWFLSRATNCRIYQDKSALDIVKEIFGDHNVPVKDDRLQKKTRRKREFCVQYRESDLDFVSRLLEEEGIYYYFSHAKGAHTVVLADDQSSHSEVEGSKTIPYFAIGNSNRRGRDHVYAVHIAGSVKSGAVLYRAYDFTRPKADLEVRRESPKGHAQDSHEVYEYADHYRVGADGEHYAQIRMEEMASRHERIQMQGNVRMLGAGDLFTLSNHPRDDQNRKYLIVASQCTMQSDGSAAAGADPYVSWLEVVPAAEPFRAPLRTARPRMFGPQTAFVVGKKGEEIDTDEYGRVKVQFMWDRQGKSDEKSSCFVRVAQVWAGNGFGGYQVPRIGEEVIVEFLGGDPDYPIITGRVYNKDNQYPYKLPGDQTKSGVKTRSSKGGSTSNFNELRFEDKKGSEEIYLHAEKDFVRVVENNDSLKVGFDKKDKGNQTVEIYNDQSVKVGAGSGQGSLTLVVQKDRKATITSGNDSLEVSQGNQSVAIKMGNQTTKLDLGKAETEALQSIELKVGQNSIKIDQTGITVKGMMVKIEGQVMVDVKGAVTQVKGDAMVQVQGGIVMIN